MTNWSVEKAREIFKIEKWGLGYFTINDSGEVCIKPSAKADFEVSLKLLVDELRKRKINPPILIRVMDILRDRIAHLSNCFSRAIANNDYQGRYYPLYPIKVNQERDVVTSMLKYGRSFGLGMEAGSKAELLIVLAMTTDLETPIVCNGYKDPEFAQLVCMAHKMGKKIIPVIENYCELETFIKVYKETGVIPQLGVRIKLSTKGVGKWAKTGGDASKFGLRIPEVMRLLERLREENLLHALNLLHFHIGSQITKIKVMKQAIVETMRVFVEMTKLGANLKYLDIGGGLGVDYDGSTDSYSTINYSIDEYASDVVYRIKQVCDENHVPHPTIFSESGRFLTAHYSLLVTNIPEVAQIQPAKINFAPLKEGFGPVQEMASILENIGDLNLVECYHDAIQYRSEALNLFNLGYLSLEQRGAMEDIYWNIMRNVLNQKAKIKLSEEEIMDLEHALSDTYFANFSVFQSLPDSWAIDQVFPVVPIHRLTEEPTKRGVIVDLTCDSDGVIEDYIGDETRNRCMPLHELEPDLPYYVGIFLIGAYQETLGELHNLFGDTHAVQVEMTGDNQYRILNLSKGDTVHDVMGYVSYNRRELVQHMRDQIEKAVDNGKLDLDESAHLMEQFEAGVHGYTYFED